MEAIRYVRYQIYDIRYQRDIRCKISAIRYVRVCSEARYCVWKTVLGLDFGGKAGSTAHFITLLRAVLSFLYIIEVFLYTTISFMKVRAVGTAFISKACS